MLLIYFNLQLKFLVIKFFEENWGIDGFIFTIKKLVYVFFIKNFEQSNNITFKYYEMLYKFQFEVWPIKKLKQR